MEDYINNYDSGAFTGERWFSAKIVYRPVDEETCANATKVLTFSVSAFPVDEYLDMPGSRMAAFKKPSTPTSSTWIVVLLFPTDGKKQAHTVANVTTGKQKRLPYRHRYAITATQATSVIVVYTILE